MASSVFRNGRNPEMAFSCVFEFAYRKLSISQKTWSYAVSLADVGSLTSSDMLNVRSGTHQDNGQSMSFRKPVDFF